MKREYRIKKYIPIILLIIIFTATNLLALSPKPKTNSISEHYRVLKVVDGDTIDILYHGKKERIRLLRIDTPERDEWGYFQAKKALKKLVGFINFRCIYPY